MIDGIAFRTTCFHIYCEPCAQNTFSKTSVCGCCQSDLSGEGEIRKIEIARSKTALSTEVEEVTVIFA